MKKLLLFLLITFQTAVLFAQNPADVDLGFTDPYGLSSQVYTTKVQSDGKILVGGWFAWFDTSSQNFLIRLNSNGTKDKSFNIGTGFSSTVKSIAIQNDGKILVGGNFNQLNGQTQNRLIRLNADGSKDTSFNINNGLNGEVLAIAIQNDGKILIGGNFTAYNSLGYSPRLMRLNSDGSVDESFNYLGTGFNANVNTIALQSDGKILAGGAFTTYNGSSQNRIIRLNSDGSKDITFSNGSSQFNGEVFAIALDSGNIFVGGDFTQYATNSVNRLIRLGSNGTYQTAFNIGTGFNGKITTIIVSTLSTLYVGGDFSSYKGTPCSKIVALATTDGTIKPLFNIGNGFDLMVRSITRHNDGRIIIGGNFNNYNNISQNYLTCLDNTGSINTNFYIQKLINHWPRTLSIQQDGKVIIGGYFTAYKGYSQNRITRINNDGSHDSTFNIGNGFNGDVETTCIQSDGKILAGGSFSTFNGISAPNITRLNTDGTKDTSFSTSLNNKVNQITIQNDGKILAVGLFTFPQNRIIRHNTNGSNDFSFNIGTGFNDEAVCIALQNDNKVLVGGWFTSYNGSSQNRLTRLNPDGSIDSAFNIGTGFNGVVATIAIQNDGKVLVGGNFTTYNGININPGFTRLNSDGTIDPTFNVLGTGINSIRKIVIQDNGKIIVSGNFISYNGTSQNRLIRLYSDGTKDSSFDIGDGFNELPDLISIYSDKKILIGGIFNSYNGTNSQYLIRLKGDSVFLSTTDFSKTKIILYPNPTKDILNFTLSESISATAYEIYNLLGEKVSYGDLNTNSISVSNLANGVYIVKIRTNEGVLISKFIKE